MSVNRPDLLRVAGHASSFIFSILLLCIIFYLNQEMRRSNLTL